MGEHRAAAPRSTRAIWVRALLALTGVFLVVVVVLKIVVDRNEADASAGPPATLPVASGTAGGSDATGLPSPSPRPNPSGSATPSPPRSPRSPQSPSRAPGADLPRLEPAPASRIVIGDLVDTGFDAVVSPIEGRLSRSTSRSAAARGSR